MRKMVRMFIFFAAPIVIGVVILRRYDVSDAEAVLLGVGFGILVMALWLTFNNIETIAKGLGEGKGDD